MSHTYFNTVKIRVFETFLSDQKNFPWPFREILRGLLCFQYLPNGNFVPNKVFQHSLTLYSSFPIGLLPCSRFE